MMPANHIPAKQKRKREEEIRTCASSSEILKAVNCRCWKDSALVFRGFLGQFNTVYRFTAARTAAATTNSAKLTALLPLLSWLSAPGLRQIFCRVIVP